MIKAMLIPFILIICFGGGMVALTKPFNVKATAVMGLLAVSVIVFGYAGGMMRVFGALGIIASLFGLYFVRGKR